MDLVLVFFITIKVILISTAMFFSIKWHHDQDKKKKNEAREPQTPDERAPGALDESANIQ